MMYDYMVKPHQMEMWFSLGSPERAYLSVFSSFLLSTPFDLRSKSPKGRFGYALRLAHYKEARRCGAKAPSPPMRRSPAPSLSDCIDHGLHRKDENLEIRGREASRRLRRTERCQALLSPLSARLYSKRQDVRTRNVAASWTPKMIPSIISK